MFDQPRYGGFKGDRPHYIGYRLITDAVENHSAKEDYCTCHNFVEVFRDRMITGMTQRLQGKDGELVKIIKQEGETIERRVRVGFNSIGEIVRPQAEIVDDLKKSGYKVSANDNAAVVNWKDVTYRTVVPNYLEVAGRLNSYSDLLMKREMEEQALEGEAEEVAWQAAKAKMEKAEPAVKAKA